MPSSDFWCTLEWRFILAEHDKWTRRIRGDQSQQTAREEILFYGTVGFILLGPPALAMRFTAFKLNALVFESACDTHSRKLLELNITLCQSSFCKPVSTSAALKKTKTSSKCGEFLSNQAILNYAVCMISLLEYFFLMHNMLAETALKENQGPQLVRFIFELENLAFHAAVLEADVEPVYW